MMLLRWHVVFPILLAAVLSIGPPGCAGKHARDGTLIPSMILASNGLEFDVNSGIDSLAGDVRSEAERTRDAFFLALRDGHRETIVMEAAPLWPRVKELAELGVSLQLARNEIGPNGAKSLRERIDNMDQNMRDLTSRLF